MRPSRMLTAVFLLVAVQWTTPLAAQDTHELLLEPGNVHWGYYDAGIEPVVTIRSGDQVYLETLLARGLERLAQQTYSLLLQRSVWLPDGRRRRIEEEYYAAL